MLFQVQIENVRPIKALTFSVDLARNAPLCIVGRNGTGKTTLAKAIMNFAFADTFRRTTSEGALSSNSSARYTFGDSTYDFTFDEGVGTLSTRQQIPNALRELIAVELPIPHGHRFSYFRTLAEADSEIRAKILLDQETEPDELIEFLTRIYGDSRFQNLREVGFQRGDCAFYRTESGWYVREDYFSSGEFFLVNLYRHLKKRTKLIFFDEIDISLDAAAQVRLVAELRRLCAKFEVNVVFTSHSLALMQTLQPGELVYLEAFGDQSQLDERPFSFVKSMMFGFTGYDRYILVEDEATKLVMEHLIRKHCPHAFYRYLIIEVGGVGQVTSLLQRNRTQEFLGHESSVIAILDGDEAGRGRAGEPATYCMPLRTLESAFESVYDQPGFAPKLRSSVEQSILPLKRTKTLFKLYRNHANMPDSWIVEVACAPHAADLQRFAEDVLAPFLTIQAGAAPGAPAPAA